MQAREWILTVAVIVVPLIIALVVTAWSLEQVRYRPKKRRPPANVARETPVTPPIHQNRQTPQSNEPETP